MAKPTLLIASMTDRESFLESHITSSYGAFGVVRLHCQGIEDVEEHLDSMEPDRLLDTVLLFNLEGRGVDAWGLEQFDREVGELAYLALAYPEVLVLAYGRTFGRTVGDHCFAEDELQKLTETLGHFLAGFRSWFDATGLRSTLKTAFWQNARMPSTYSAISNTRSQLPAAVAEDERSFLIFEAYALYRIGYRTVLLPTEKEFRRNLLQSGTQALRFGVLVSDWQLAYADHKGMDDFELVRKVEENAVAKVRVVTNSQRITELQEWSATRKNVSFLRKPISGIVALSDLKPSNPSDPPPPIAVRTQHDAPFITVRIAHKLLSRARRIVKDAVDSVETAVHVALLAGEAKEILGGFSRTLSFEAMSLQATAETRAEALFFGVSLGPDVVRQRLRLVMDEVHQIGGTPATQPLSPSERNCVVRTIRAIRKTYSDLEQYDASEECLRQYADVDRADGLIGAFYRYSDLVTKAGTSVGALMVTNLLISLAFAAYYWALLVSFVPQQDWSWQAGYAVAHSFFTFVELSPGPPEWQNLRDFGGGAIWPILIYPAEFVELVLAYVNLGLLVSLLYRRITRRAP